MFLQYVDNGVLHLTKKFISRLVEGTLMLVFSSGFIFRSVEVFKSPCHLFVAVLNNQGGHSLVSCNLPCVNTTDQVTVD